MANKEKNWRGVIKNKVLLRIMDVIDNYENGETAKFLRQIGIDRSTYNTWMSRDNTPAIDMLVKIKKAYGVSLDWLVCGDGDIGEFDGKGSSEQSIESRVEELEKKYQKLIDKLSSKVIKKK